MYLHGYTQIRDRGAPPPSPNKVKLHGFLLARITDLVILASFCLCPGTPVGFLYDCWFPFFMRYKASVLLENGLTLR